MTAKSDVCTPWATAADLMTPCDDYTLDALDIDRALLMASDVLYNFTGRRWPGVCAETVRPLLGCGDVNACRCGRVREFLLPGSPVVSVTEVLVDGDVVPSNEYRVDDTGALVGLTKADGTPRDWPACQDMSLDTGETNTWSVTYEYGAEPPVGGVVAAASLACQLVMAFQPEAVRDGRCRLPKRVTTITRQGVTLAILDPLSLFRDGLTGLAEVDLWVSSVNGQQSKRRASFIDPLRVRAARRESTA